MLTFRYSSHTHTPFHPSSSPLLECLYSHLAYLLPSRGHTPPPFPFLRLPRLRSLNISRACACLRKTPLFCIIYAFNPLASFVPIFSQSGCVFGSSGSLLDVLPLHKGFFVYAYKLSPPHDIILHFLPSISKEFLSSLRSRVYTHAPNPVL